MQKNDGMSLIELLITILIIGVLTTAAITMSSEFLVNQRAKQVVGRIRTALNLARQEATSRGGYVTLCRSADGKTCGGEWRDGQILFTNANGDGHVDAEDKILRVFAPLNAGDSLTWSGFPGTVQYITMTPSGFTKGQNGSFSYCPSIAAKRYAQSIIVNKAGRVRIDSQAIVDCG